jgi:hypothetical protein
MPKELAAQASEERVEMIGLDQFCEEQGITPDLIKVDLHQFARLTSLQNH